MDMSSALAAAWKALRVDALSGRWVNAVVCALETLLTFIVPASRWGSLAPGRSAARLPHPSEAPARTANSWVAQLPPRFAQATRSGCPDGGTEG
ncbi:hypothetical protein Aglo01_33150 [Actinokineospora globicatena]|nr:hypothetical protein Aglo01_33150 [Actinokineospora globicatena]GLW86754.1 hypothetical protein Aglo02_43930 [Actinokineospora globicatena]